MNTKLKQFSLSSDWPTWALTPLQEASEYLATEQEDGAAFWAFVDALAPEVDAPAAKPPLSRELFDKARGNTTFDGRTMVQMTPTVLDRTKDATLGLHPVSHALLELYMGIGAMSPTLELHRSLRQGTLASGGWSIEMRCELVP